MIQAGRLGIFYYGVLLLIKRPFMSTGVSQHSSDVVMPPECQTAVRMTVNLFDAIVPVGLLSGWSLSGKLIWVYYLSQQANLYKKPIALPRPKWSCF
jgi:hypothetical protein